MNNAVVVVAGHGGLQPVEIRSRGGAPRGVDGGAKGHINSDPI